MNKGQLTQPLRALGLMHFFHRVKFALQRIQFRKSNQTFIQQNPTVALPPDYILFEAYYLNYQKYYEGGRETAEELLELLANFTDFEDKKILDWGCGPARIIRHLPDLLPASAQVFGSDYNPKTIEWCQSTFQNITFRKNELVPPLAFEPNFFDVVYSISVFTHLSEANHLKWYEELMRVTKSGAILKLTTHGNAFKEKLTPEEIKRFENNELVTRGNVMEGHDVFIAFHPIPYLQQLFSRQSKILQHIPGKKQNWGIEQDIWIIQKN